MIEGGWNPYFVAFAHAHGCTPEAMARGPRIAARRTPATRPGSTSGSEPLRAHLRDGEPRVHGRVQHLPVPEE